MPIPRILILGAAGRDFHNFNVAFRDRREFEVVAFTAAQIPNIENRRYPPELSGPLYPRGIPVDPLRAAAGADVVYTDTWMSYHIPAEKREARFRALEPFRVGVRLMDAAKGDAIFMHCLPAQRGIEVDADVIDGPRSVVFDQAENRLHTEKALLIMMLGRATPADRAGSASS
jgi:hypothetical protein